MTKKIAVSARLDQLELESFRNLYLTQLNNALATVEVGLKKEIMDEVNNTELMAAALKYAVIYLRDRLH